MSLLRNADDARDATQETGLRFLRLLPKFRGDSSITTWSLGIAINVVREMRRKRRPELTGDDFGNIDDAEPGPEGSAEGHERERVLREALKNLSDRQREAVVCRYFEDLSTEETAKVMNCAPGTVKATLHQALRALKNKVRQLA